MNKIIAVSWMMVGFNSFGGVLHKNEKTKKYMGNFGPTSGENKYSNAVMIIKRGIKISYEEALDFFPKEMKTITQDEYKY
jgi:uncharacterized spore protein YtfJ